MEKHNGFIIKNKWGSYLLWTADTTKKEVKRKVPEWREWLKLGHKIIKFKIVEVA